MFHFILASFNFFSSFSEHYTEIRPFEHESARVFLESALLMRVFMCSTPFVKNLWSSCRTLERVARGFT